MEIMNMAGSFDHHWCVRIGLHKDKLTAYCDCRVPGHKSPFSIHFKACTSNAATPKGFRERLRRLSCCSGTSQFPVPSPDQPSLGAAKERGRRRAQFHLPANRPLSLEEGNEGNR
jgi:hypothetical protein